MVSIDDRISKHEEARLILLNDRKIAQSKLDNINEHLRFHYIAIQNLKAKKIAGRGKS